MASDFSSFVLSGPDAAPQTQLRRKGYKQIGLEDEYGVSTWQKPDGSIVQMNLHKEPGWAPAFKGLVAAGLGAGFGALGASAIGGIGGATGDAALAGGAATDTLGAGAASSAAFPDAASLITPQVLGAGSFGGGFAPDALALGLAGGGSGIGAGGAAALGAGAGLGIGSALANVGSPSELASNFSYPSGSEATSNLTPETIAAGGTGLGGVGSALNTAGQLATVGGVASGLLGSDNSASNIDPKLLDLIMQNYARAQGIANQPYQPYTGQLSAGLNSNQTQAGNMYAALPNAGASTLNSAIGNAQPTSILSGMAQYQNPYTNDVINTTLADINRSREMAVNQGNGTATQSGAFGGSRQGVADSLTNEAYGRIGAQTAAGLRSQGFNTAANLSGQDVGNRLQSSELLGQYGQQQFNNAQTSANSLLGYGTLAQQTEQANLDRQLQQYQAAQQWPFQTQGLLNESAGLVPAAGSQVPGGQYAGLGSLFTGANALGSALFGNTSNSGGLLGGLGRLFGGNA